MLSLILMVPILSQEPRLGETGVPLWLMATPCLEAPGASRVSVEAEFHVVKEGVKRFMHQVITSCLKRLIVASRVLPTQDLSPVEIGIPALLGSLDCLACP